MAQDRATHAQPVTPCGSAPSPDEVFARLRLIGDSPAFRAALSRVVRVAGRDVTVLIQGETGTGKELFARAVHYLSARRNGPFIPVNCGALPPSLVEAELFGHERGAFTDARAPRPGLIRQADGGTLFLDEVQALSSHAQVALLRFLQEHQYRPIGGVQQVANVRVVAATNASLVKLSKSGDFREDLYFRLNLFEVTVPALRDRGTDAVTLAQAFVQHLGAEDGTGGKSLDPSVLQFIQRCPWPGNVRELEHFIHRLLILSDGPVVTLDEGSGAGPDSAGTDPSEDLPSFREAKSRAIAAFERRYLEALMRHTRGNVSEAARLSGKERSRFVRLLRKHGFGRAGSDRG